MTSLEDFTKSIPQGWVRANLTELTALNPALNRKIEDANQEVVFVPMAAVDVEFGGIKRPEVRSYGAVKKGYTPFLGGDVILAKITPCMENGKGGVAPGGSETIYFGSTEFHVFRPRREVEPLWIAHFLSQEMFRRTARLNMKGSAGQLRVPAEFLIQTSLPLPPRAEQRRILDRIDELFTDLDAGVAALVRVQKKLKRYRAALLHAAVTGRLTADWRAKSGDVSESGQKLLQSILKARKDEWERTTLAKYAEEERDLPKDWRDRYRDPPLVEPSMGDDPLPLIPGNWVWTTIGRCFEIRVGGTPSRSREDFWKGDVGWVSSGEIQFCRIKETRETITKEGVRNSNAKPIPKGSVLLGMIGEGKTRGQVAILDIEAAHNQNSAGILVSKSPVPTEYVYFWLWSQYDSTRKRGSGGNQPALNKARVEAIPFPLPPIAESIEISGRLEAQLSLIDSTLIEVNRGLQRAARFRHAILKAAFEGKLVSQDFKDEPASELLKRIQAEIASEASTETTSTRTKRASKKSPKTKPTPLLDALDASSKKRTRKSKKKAVKKST